ncbi:lysylphosphatidylglycerol synthase domain-containing protein [Actinomycetes bacterium KLBMP 9797]
MTWRPWLDRGLAVLFLGLLGVGLVTVLRGQDWTPLARLSARLEPVEIALILTAAVLVNGVGLIFGVLSWRALFLDLGAPVGTWTAVRIFFVGFLTKFVPGRFVALPVLVRMGKAIDVGPVRLASVFVLSWGIVTLTGLTIGIAAGPAVAGLSTGWLLAAALPTIALVIRPDLLNWGIRTGARLLRRPPPAVAASRAGIRRSIAAQALSWVISGHHLWLLAVVAGAPPARSYLVCVAGFAVAAVAGILVMIVPDGLGVREAVLAVGLATVMPLPLATTVVLASRVVSVLTDVAVGTIGLAVAHHLHRRRHHPPHDQGVPQVVRATTGTP